MDLAGHPIAVTIVTYKAAPFEFTVHEPDGALVPELEPIRDFTERLKVAEEAVMDSCSYRIGGERFLNRFPANRQVFER